MVVRQNSPSTVRPAAVPRKTSPSTPQTAVFGPFFVRWANFFAHRQLRRGDFETGDTSAATDAGQRETAITSATADAGQHETAITNARPQTATIETTITSATEKHTKNAHFSPTKAMPVSVEAEPARAKAMEVSVGREQRRRRFQTTAPRAATCPFLRKVACNSIGRRFNNA